MNVECDETKTKNHQHHTVDTISKQYIFPCVAFTYFGGLFVCALWWLDEAFYVLRYADRQNFVWLCNFYIYYWNSLNMIGWAGYCDAFYGYNVCWWSGHASESCWVIKNQKSLSYFIGENINRHFIQLNIYTIRRFLFLFIKISAWKSFNSEN